MLIKSQLCDLDIINRSQLSGFIKWSRRPWSIFVALRTPFKKQVCKGFLLYKVNLFLSQKRKNGTSVDSACWTMELRPVHFRQVTKCYMALCQAMGGAVLIAGEPLSQKRWIHITQSTPKRTFGHFQKELPIEKMFVLSVSMPAVQQHGLWHETQHDIWNVPPQHQLRTHFRHWTFKASTVLSFYEVTLWSVHLRTMTVML